MLTIDLAVCLGHAYSPDRQYFALVERHNNREQLCVYDAGDRYNLVRVRSFFLEDGLSVLIIEHFLPLVLCPANNGYSRRFLVPVWKVVGGLGEQVGGETILDAGVSSF